MKLKLDFKLLFFSIFIWLFIPGCNPEQVETPVSPSPTVDVCGPENITASLNPIHGMIREFNDAADIAFSAPIEQLNPPVARLQVLRDNFSIIDNSECLPDLHREGLQYMDATLELFQIFLDDPYAETVNLKLEIIDIRWEYYLNELSAAYGVPLTPSPTPIVIMIEEVAAESESNDLPTATAAPSATPSPTETPIPTEIIPEVAITSDGVTVRAGPGVDYTFLLNLAEGSIVQALGKNENGDWIKVLLEYEGIETGWVFASQVTLNIPIDELEISEFP